MDMMKIATESMTKKQPRTFSLSRDVIDILERYKKERKAGSLTAAVEEIVREWTTVQMAQQVAAYYDSLSDEEVAQEKNWGAFSETQL
ncbi:MAG: hypothetical protein DMG84_06290 [Acidobacteria bacterium]|jgi:hypothetical protein|nr:MAG: hypothetical protein AUI17_05095 [Acidobacteriales bacterium 13_2_20CM_2_55_5]PYX16795.1 MAG: hypothetical protein DMG84_06290 [Acidobacteriota bacterium]